MSEIDFTLPAPLQNAARLSARDIAKMVHPNRARVQELIEGHIKAELMESMKELAHQHRGLSEEPEAS